MCHGVVKSGSPTPSEITPSVDAIRSKNFRIPDDGRSAARCDTRDRRAVFGSVKVGHPTHMDNGSRPSAPSSPAISVPSSLYRFKMKWVEVPCTASITASLLLTKFEIS